MFISLFLLCLQSLLRAAVSFVLLLIETRLLISWHMYCDIEVMKAVQMFACFSLLFNQIKGHALWMSVIVVLSPSHSEVPCTAPCYGKVSCAYSVMFLLIPGLFHLAVTPMLSLLAYSMSLCAPGTLYCASLVLILLQNQSAYSLDSEMCCDCSLTAIYFSAV